MSISIRRLLGGLLCGMFLSSCIPVKQMVFVRKEEPKGNAINYTAQNQQYLYKIQKTDVLNIQLQDDLVLNPQLQFPASASAVPSSGSGKPYLVDDEGMVKLPEIGKVEVAGLTLMEAVIEIEKRADGYISDPIIRVSLESYPIKVLGEVNMPGLYEARSNAPTLFEAIAMAQGLSNYANRKEVQLIRSSGGELEIVYFDVTSPDFAESQYYFMHPGDVLVFNPVASKRFEDRSTTYFLSALSSLVVILNLVSTWR